MVTARDRQQFSPSKREAAVEREAAAIQASGHRLMRAVTVKLRTVLRVAVAAQLGGNVIGQQQRRARWLVVGAETIITVPPAHRATTMRALP
jgi:hypothetical protein